MALYRFNHFVAKHADKGQTPGGTRWEVFNEDKNGLAESGAIVREGRKLYIDEDKYFNWKRSGGKRSAA